MSRRISRQVLLGGLLLAALAAHLSSIGGHGASLRSIRRGLTLSAEELRRESLPGDLHDFLVFCRREVPPEASFLLLTPDRYLYGVRRYALSPRQAITYRPEWRGGEVDRALLEGRGPPYAVVYLASNHVPGTAPAYEAFEEQSRTACRAILEEMLASGAYEEVASLDPGRKILRRVEVP